MWFVYFCIVNAVMCNITFWSIVSYIFKEFSNKYEYKKPELKGKEYAKTTMWAIEQLLFIFLILCIPFFNIIIALGSMYVDRNSMIQYLVKQFNATPKE